MKNKKQRVLYEIKSAEFGESIRFFAVNKKDGKKLFGSEILVSKKKVERCSDKDDDGYNIAGFSLKREDGKDETEIKFKIIKEAMNMWESLTYDTLLNN